MAVLSLPSAPALPRRRSAILDFCRQQPLGAISFVVIVVMMFAGIFAERVAPYNPLDIDFAGILAAPSWEHWAAPTRSAATSSRASSTARVPRW